MELSVWVQNNFCVEARSKWTLYHCFSTRQTFNEKKHLQGHRAHTHTENNATSSPPQIILSNCSLTPAVSEHFPRVHSHNQTTKGDQSTRKTKHTPAPPPYLPLCPALQHLPWRPKALCHLLVSLGSTCCSWNAKPEIFLYSVWVTRKKRWEGMNPTELLTQINLFILFLLYLRVLCLLLRSFNILGEAVWGAI